MKIRIKADGHNISIPIPTGLIFSKPSVWLYLKLTRKYASHAKEYIPGEIEISADAFLTGFPDETVYALCAEIMRIKRRYGSWELVHVISADGSEVYITL